MRCTAAAMARHRVRPESGGRPAGDCQDGSQPHDGGSTAHVRGKRFGCKISKKSLESGEIKPAVHSVLQEYAGSCGKRISAGLSSKYVFTIYSFATDFVLLIKYSF